MGKNFIHKLFYKIFTVIEFSAVFAMAVLIFVSLGISG